MKSPTMHAVWLPVAIAAGSLLPSACADLVQASSAVYYFADCQAGAAADCVPGNNANKGNSPDAPRRDLAGFNVDDLPGGTQLLFKRGGAWNWKTLRLENLNATPAAPLVFDAYGSGPAPVWRTRSGSAVDFGGYRNTSNDGGYVFRHIKLDGAGTGQWGFWMHDNLRNVTLEKVEITGFEIAIHAQPSPPHGITGFVLRDSNVSRNREMGMLGQYEGAVIEGNTFEANNFSGSAFHHAIYLSGGAAGGNNGVMRNNRFINNSTVNGVCKGGNVTAHGQMSGWLFEGNLIQQDAAAGGCYGFSITPGYNTAEWFRNFVVRGNTVVNAGNCAICAGAAPGIVVENNTIVQSQPAFHRGIEIPANVKPGSPVSAGDDVDNGAVVRNNTIYFVNPHASSAGVALGGAGTTTQNNNLNSKDASEFVEVPSAANAWRCRVAPGARNHGSCAR
jgi:hypothetical protein